MSDDPRRFSRRDLLGRAAVGSAALALGGCTAETAAPEPAATAEQTDEGVSTGAAGPGGPPPRFIEFAGPHQAGITADPAQYSMAASFDCLARDRDELAETLQALTDETRNLMAGVPPETRPRAFPPVDSGVMGPEPDPTNLTVIVSVGASLFDDRYGLADRKPRELITMPFMANDRLDPEQSHGDILLTVAAARPDAVAFAIRQLMRATRRTLILHWTLEGFTRRDQPDRPPGTTQFRNLMGFKDGSANLDASVPELMDRFVWVQPDDDEPDWCVGGSYHAFRTIRMFVEFWDRTPLSEQEAIMGRHRASGAPLGQDNESDPPDFADDPDGDVIPLDAHIRLANPRTPETDENLILRRGFSFSRGFDDAGRLDQGLAFVSYQRSLERGFIAVQNRLSGEPLEEYILPVGGGFFFALPGVTTEDGFLGEGLVA